MSQEIKKIPEGIIEATNLRVGFNTSDSWIGKLIRWATKGVVSHVYLAYNDVTTGQPMVIEAAWNGFVAHSRDNALSGTKVVKEFKLVGDGMLEQKILSQSMRWLGRAYDYRGLVGAAVVQVGRWFKKKWANPLQDSNALFCSEAIARALKEAHYPNADKLAEPSQVSPQDLFDWFEAHK